MVWGLVKQSQPKFCSYLHTSKESRRNMKSHFKKKGNSVFLMMLVDSLVATEYHLQIEQQGGAEF